MRMEKRYSNAGLMRDAFSMRLGGGEWLGENEVVNVNTFEGGSLSFRIKRRDSLARAKFLVA
jgi:hypothetical protein